MFVCVCLFLCLCVHAAAIHTSAGGVHSAMFRLCCVRRKERGVVQFSPFAHRGGVGGCVGVGGGYMGACGGKRSWGCLYVHAYMNMYRDMHTTSATHAASCCIARLSPTTTVRQRGSKQFG
eukprot:GHVS01051794.1.p2 GENE.GHVS01051794.1~~GHVS01051794.1.p2  ORF type:complete len:121 (+),score=8.79 GHVS01051794.1:635-997(+)